MIYCPICHNECTLKYTAKTHKPLGVSCEIITSSEYYHRFIHFSNNDFMIAVYYPGAFQQEECYIIIGGYPSQKTGEYTFVFSIKNKTIPIKQFDPCRTLELMNKYLKVSTFI